MPLLSYKDTYTHINTHTQTQTNIITVVWDFQFGKTPASCGGHAIRVTLRQDLSRSGLVSHLLTAARTDCCPAVHHLPTADRSVSEHGIP